MALADRQQRARGVARRAGCDALVAADPGTVWWLTGAEMSIDVGPSPFAAPALALVVGDEPVRLVMSVDEAPAAVDDTVTLETYEGFTTGPLRGPERAAGIVARVLAGRRAAGEPMAVPVGLVPAGSITDVAGELMAARAIKDRDELAALRDALDACDAGQRFLREVVTAGMTEIELFGEVRTAIESHAGQRTPLLADLVSGPRTADMGGHPSSRTLAEGELVLCDLAPRVRGAWADSCATVAVGGDAPSAVRAAHARVLDALGRALSGVRAGVRAADVDAVVRGDLGYPHHTGHGIGGSYHEQPRLVPGSSTVLLPGMVVAVEPACYQAGFGIRLEHVLLVTDDGCEDLSGHSLEL